MQIDFSKVAPYLKDPLVLIGFFLFVSFLFARYLVKQRVIPPLPPTLGFKILKTMLLYGFIIGLLLILLGFGLKFKELKDKEQQSIEELKSRERQAAIDRETQDRLRKADEEKKRKEQENLVGLLDEEMTSNLQVASELQKNSTTLLNEFNTIATVLRTPGIKLLAVMFPKENLEAKLPDSAASSLADQAFKTIVDTNLNKDELEKQKLSAAARAITSTIDATSATVKSLSDPNHQRYRFSSEVWTSNLSVLRTVLVSDLTPYQQSYADLNRLRDDYDVVTARIQDYFGALRDYLDPVKHSVNVDSLRHVLAQERYAYSLITAFGKALVKDSKNIRGLQTKIKGLKAQATVPRSRGPYVDS